jgi:hypothetical protein
MGSVTRLSYIGLFALLTSCRPSPHAPFMIAGAESQPSTDAVLEVSWPTSSCDQAGYLTIMTSDGAFIGNLSTGTKIRTALPAGDVELIAGTRVSTQTASLTSRTP